MAVGSKTERRRVARPSENDASAAATTLQLHGVGKRYGDTWVTADVSLDLRGDEFLALLGPSGCGKTTILRSIAGIVTPDAGEIVLNGENITRKPLHRRNIALVFQNYALFPHLSVFDNVAFGLKMRRLSRKDIARRVRTALDLVRLPSLADRFPAQLSGGQQQRVSLARALVVEPTLLLLDEPLSNLDARLREEMRSELRRVQRTLGVATILVTHDIEEAFAVADRIVVMNGGRIEQTGTAAELYRTPQSRFVAEFVGHSNLFESRVVDGDASTIRARIAEDLDIAVDREILDCEREQHAWIVIPPECVRLGVGATTLQNRFSAEVEDVTYLGGVNHYVLRIGAVRLRARTQNERRPYQPGERLVVGWAANECIGWTC